MRRIPRRFAGPLAARWAHLLGDGCAGLLVPAADSLPVPPASDRDTWDPARVDPATLRALQERAEQSRGEPWPVPLATDYVRYARDGDREVYERMVWARDRRLTRAAVLAAVTLHDAWLDEVADGVTLLCEQSN